MEKLKEIIKNLKKIRESEKLLVDDGVLFENSVKIFLSEKIQEFKERNIMEVRKEKKKNKLKEEPATKKQIDYLIGLGIEIPKGLTKKEASKLIEENKNLI